MSTEPKREMIAVGRIWPDQIEEQTNLGKRTSLGFRGTIHNRNRHSEHKSRDRAALFNFLIAIAFNTN